MNLLTEAKRYSRIYEKGGCTMAVRTRDDIARVLAPKMGMTHQESEHYLTDKDIFRVDWKLLGKDSDYW